MKNLKLVIVSVFFFTVIGQSNAQFFQKLADGGWVIGAGWNIVDDNGQKLSNLFGQKGAWNLLAYPSSVRVEKGYNKGLSFVFQGSYNNYRDSKTINNDYDQSSQFFAFDLNAKFNFVSLYDINAEWFNFANDVFDVYGSFGGGYTYRSTAQVGSAGTVNLGVGMNAYLIDNWGVNLDATAKFGVQDFWQTATNYTQYSIGVIYMLSSSKRLYGTHKSRPSIH